jgi:hypothetical protein
MTRGETSRRCSYPRDATTRETPPHPVPSRTVHPRACCTLPLTCGSHFFARQGPARPRATSRERWAGKGRPWPHPPCARACAIWAPAADGHLHLLFFFFSRMMMMMKVETGGPQFSQLCVRACMSFIFLYKSLLTPSPHL